MNTHEGTANDYVAPKPLDKTPPTAVGGFNLPQPQGEVCPACGRCPHCGHTPIHYSLDYYWPYTPRYPYPVVPYMPPYQITC